MPVSDQFLQELFNAHFHEELDDTMQFLEH